MKLGIKPGCLSCVESICDACDDRSPTCDRSALLLGSTFISYWSKGFRDGKEGRRPRMTPQTGFFPGYVNGFKAGTEKRMEELTLIKDHNIAQAVNQLTEIARQYHGAQQLRERISRVVVDLWHGRTQGSTTKDTK